MAQRRIVEPRLPQDGSAEVGARQIGVVESGTKEIRALELGTGQARTAQVRLGKLKWCPPARRGHVTPAERSRTSHTLLPLERPAPVTHDLTPCEKRADGSAKYRHQSPELGASE